MAQKKKVMENVGFAGTFNNKKNPFSRPKNGMSVVKKSPCTCGTLQQVVRYFKARMGIRKYLQFKSFAYRFVGEPRGR